MARDNINASKEGQEKELIVNVKPLRERTFEKARDSDYDSEEDIVADLPQTQFQV